MENNDEYIPVSVCANPDCEYLIYPGDQVWKKGKDLFCKGECLQKSFEQQKEKQDLCSNTDPE